MTRVLWATAVCLVVIAAACAAREPQPIVPDTRDHQARVEFEGRAVRTRR